MCADYLDRPVEEGYTTDPADHYTDPAPVTALLAV